MIKHIINISLSIIISGFIYPVRSDFLSKKECKESIENELKNLTIKKTKKRKFPIWSKDVLDINNDQKKEILITRTDGGNSNAPDLEMIFFNSKCIAKKYEFNEFTGVWNGWEGINFKTTNKGLIIYATNHHEGFFNTELKVNKVEYLFSGENLYLLSNRNQKEIKAISEIRTSNLKFNAPHYTKTSLIYDLNNDREEETISCTYWDRWGRFNKCFIQSEDNYKIEMNFNPKRIGVLKNKKNGWHLLVIDINEKYFYNPNSKKYEKL